MTRFVLKMAWRETRAGWRHFIYFLICIAVGVGAVVGVSLFGAHVERAVTKEARALLGGDLETRLSRPISPEGQSVLDSFADRGIVIMRVSELVAMAARTDGPAGQGPPTQIIELKAVEREYPFYGAVRVEPSRPLEELLGHVWSGCPGVPQAAEPNGARSVSTANDHPCYGAVVQESLLIRMGLTVGDRLKIGQALFVITGIVRTEPDRIANAFSLGPRVLISQEALRASELVQVGSRIRERYLFKIPPATAPEPLVYELRGRLKAEGARVSGYRDAQPQLKQFLEQLTRYLGLIGLTALFIGGLGVATSIHAFVREKLHTIAVLKTVGADSATVIATYGVQALLLGSLGSVVGLIFGILLQQALPGVVAGLFKSDLLVQLGFAAELSVWSLVPLVKGLALGLLSTLLFALWPLLTIREIKPAMIFRRDVVPLTPEHRILQSWRTRWGAGDGVKMTTALAIGAGLVGLSMWQAGSWKVGIFFIGAFLAAVLLLSLSASAVIVGLKKSPRPTALSLRQALGNVIRPGSQAVSITVAIGIGVMVVVTVSLVERSLLGQVGETRPTNSPTFFFIDIQPDQKDQFARLVEARGNHATPELIPLVRSRLSAVNGRAIKLEASTEEEEQKERDGEKEERRKKWYASREYVLTFLNDLPKDNEVVEGEWWQPGQVSSKALVSVEEEAARALGVKVGDTVEFNIQGAEVAAEISSIRKVEWGNFSTNFYMILSPGALDGAPVTYVGTVRVEPAEEVALQQAVVASFPNVTAINVGDVLQSFATVLDRLSLAIRAVALFCVFSGALVMAAALAATRYRRLYESVILKSIGATRGVIARSFAAEYALLGAVGGLLGSLLASVLSWGVLTFIFDLTWTLQPAILATGFAATIALTVMVGFLSTFRILGQPPLAVLRHE